MRSWSRWFIGAALAVAGAALVSASASPSPAGSDAATTAANPTGAASFPQVRTACRIEPHLLDVSRPAGALVARIEIFSPDGLSAIDARSIAPGVHLRTVNGQPLPAPGGGEEGIAELRAARTVEDRIDARGGGKTPNGIPEAVIRFVRASDGNAATSEDGNADDVIAMLTDVPDGRSVQVCLTGRAAEGAFTCCDSVVVRNRGLRNLPRVLAGPDVSGAPPAGADQR